MKSDIFYVFYTLFIGPKIVENCFLQSAVVTASRTVDIGQHLELMRLHKATRLQKTATSRKCIAVVCCGSSFLSPGRFAGSGSGAQRKEAGRAADIVEFGSC